MLSPARFIALGKICVLVSVFSIAIFPHSPQSKTSFTNKVAKTTPANIDTNQLKESGWYAHAINNIYQGEYEIHWQQQLKTFQAPNRAHNIRGSYYPNKLVMQARDRKDDWQLQIQLESINANNEVLYVPFRHSPAASAGGEITFNHNNLFKVQYINNEKGIRQNFIIQQAPANAAEKVSVCLSINRKWFISQVKKGELHFVRSGTADPNKKIIYNGLKVWDAHHKELDAQFVITDSAAFDIVVNTSQAAYPITIDPLITTGNWQVESDASNAKMGFSNASAGDVNGDGYSDVILGAPYFESGGSVKGKVFVYYGSATGLSSTPGWTAEGNNNNAQYGSSVATAGDINKDGFSDIIVGDAGYDNSETDAGKVFIYYGSAFGLKNTPDPVSPEGNQDYSWMGSSVACAGDVNADGYSDIIIGEPGQNSGGRVLVYYGSSSGLLSTPWSMSGPLASWFGRSVGCAGDVNGDGFSDIIIGAPAADGQVLNAGKVFLYYGSPAGVSSISWESEGNQDPGRYGCSVSTAGDVNGDGFSDVIIGSDYFTSDQTWEGAAFVYYGSPGGLSAIPAWTVEGNQDDAALGCSVASAGDVDGDGFGDVIIGAYGAGLTNSGKAYIYFGSGDGLSGASTPLIKEGTQADEGFGYNVACAGDVDGDGFSDIIIGSPDFSNIESREGKSSVFHGASGQLPNKASWTAEGNSPIARFGSSISSAGDVNGDGYSDVIIGAPEYIIGGTKKGRVFLYYG
jgi:flavodoxin